MDESKPSKPQEMVDWENQPHIQALIADLKEKHPDYTDSMIYQMSWMRSHDPEVIQ